MITLDQHIANIKALRDRMVEESRPLFLASQSALTDMLDRIFIEGRSIGGSRFQYNSSDPLYVDPNKTFGNTSKLKPPTGKTGRTVFKSTGKPHKTTYVESYKALRGLVGREDSYVNWKATGDLESEIANTSGGLPEPRKVSPNEYVVKVSSSENTGKLEGLMNKYTNVFEISPKEEAVFQRIYRLETLKLLREGLRS